MTPRVPELFVNCSPNVKAFGISSGGGDYLPVIRMIMYSEGHFDVKR